MTEANVRMSTDRTFGIVFFVVLAAVGLFPALGGSSVRLWALGISGVFLLLALVAPRSLRPLNLVWTRFGLLLHQIVSPIALGIVFFLTIAPIGLVLRALGKDPLRLGFDKNADSYWRSRVPPGPDPKTMINQF